MSTLFYFAFTGVSLIPTILLIIILVYWITVILGAIDLDFLDFDLDLDLDGDGIDGFQGILAFLNLKDMPVMIVFSVLLLVFWVICMLFYFLPASWGGVIQGLLMIPALILSAFITKVVTNPLKGVFSISHGTAGSQDTIIIGQFVTMTCDMKDDRIGQAEVKRDGASLLINVKAEMKGETFQKREEVYVTRKDDRDVYYVVKLKMENPSESSMFGTK